MYNVAWRITNDEDFSFAFQVLGEDGQPLADFADLTFEFSILDEDECVAFALSHDDGISTDPDNGTVYLSRTQDNIRALEPGSYRGGLRCSHSDDGWTIQLFTMDLTIEEGGFA